MTRIETDYLVIGAGAAGMAFVDTLLERSDADVVMVDRRFAPGGHWLEAYPFVRLHQPSHFYGVASTVLGTDAVHTHGTNAGFLDRAGAAEIQAYYERVMRERFVASGRVRFFPGARWLGAHRFVSLGSGEEHDVVVRKRLVDARYLEGNVPASSPPPFEVAPGARCIPVGEMVRVTERPERWTVIGGGKTGSDACTWLLEQGVPPVQIRWVKPRDTWLINRTYLEGRGHLATFLDGLGVQVEAAAAATSAEDLLSRLEAGRQLLRVDRDVTPTMFRGATISEREIELLRSIDDVVRLGHVRRLEPGRLVLDGGELETSPRTLHVHCAAGGIVPAPAVPMFSDGRIVLQSIRIGLLPFAAALTAFVEASARDDAAKNRLCPPAEQPNVPLDWLRGTLRGMQAEHLWSREPDVAGWLDGSRLNITSGLRARRGEPDIAAATARYGASARAAVANLERLLSAA